MTDVNFDANLTEKKQDNGFIALLVALPVIGWFINAYRYGKDSDIALSILSIVAALGLAVYHFGYPVFLGIMLTAALGYMILLVYAVAFSKH